MKKRKIRKGNMGAAKAFLLSLLTFAAVYTMLVLIFSIAAYMSDDPIGRAKAFSLAALLISGIIGGFAVGGEGERIALLCALLFSVVLITLGALASGTAPGIGNIINYAIYIGISYVSARIRCKRGNKRLRRR